MTLRFWGYRNAITEGAESDTHSRADEELKHPCCDVRERKGSVKGSKGGLDGRNEHGKVGRDTQPIHYRKF